MTTVEFTEEMKGYVTLGETDFRKGFDRGKKDGTYLMFHLTIEAEDIDTFLADPDREAVARGWVRCDALGGKQPVEQGIFNLFVDTEDPDLKRMLYRLYFADGVGHPLTLSGFKLVKDDPGLDLWSDTSTLYTKILAGHVDAAAEPTAEVVAAGIITIHLVDFAQQLTTFRSRDGSLGDRARALERFGKLFLGDLWKVYGGKAKASAQVE
ncbi:MAG TPA: hypothetical protein VF045_01230 [Acidimicrobiales bacterium]